MTYDPKYPSLNSNVDPNVNPAYDPRIDVTALEGQPAIGKRVEWNIGSGTGTYLRAQADRPNSPIKDVYDIASGQKIGAYNTETGTKYYQTATETVPNRAVGGVALYGGSPFDTPSTAQIVEANQKIVEEAPVQQTTNNKQELRYSGY